IIFYRASIPNARHHPCFGTGLQRLSIFITPFVNFSKDPLTTLRDNMTVALQDAEGNEISNTGVQTMSVVEKGLWDEFLPLGEGGHVHMRLQFVLSEEERNRVRSMRESALKKKHRELAITNLRRSETASTGGVTVTSSSGMNHEVSDSHKRIKDKEVMSSGDPSIHPDTLKNSEGAAGNEEGTAFCQRHIKPNDSDGSEETSSAASKSKRMDVHLGGVNQSKSVEKTDRKLGRIDFLKRPILLQEALSSTKKNLVDSELKNDRADQPNRQDPLEKAPRNVRKMISAFESSLSKNVRPVIKPPPIGKWQYDKVGWEAPKDLNLEEITQPTKLSSGKLINPFLTGGIKQIPTYGMKREKHIVFDKNLRKSSLDSEKLEEPSAIQFQSEESKSIATHEQNSPEDLMRMTIGEAATAKHIVFDIDVRKSYWHSRQLEEKNATQFQSKKTESIAKDEWNSQEDLVRLTVSEAATAKQIVFDKESRKSSWYCRQLEKPSATEFQSKETKSIPKHEWNSQEDLVRMTAGEAATTKQIVTDKDSRKSSWDFGQLAEPSSTQFQSKETESIAKHEWNSQEDLVRMNAIEAATVLGNMHEDHSRLIQPCILLVNQEDSSGTSITEGCGSGIRSSNSHEIKIQGISEDKLKSAALCENEHSSSESSGAWIFPDHARSLCVTTGSKKVMELVEGCEIKERTHEGKKINFSLLANVEKVIKVAIMVAFGALVLLTRQKKHR
ncbi:hypothetical protein U1Q18_018046, partial [Sarracenia purpurea var. burkii]